MDFQLAACSLVRSKRNSRVASYDKEITRGESLNIFVLWLLFVLCTYRRKGENLDAHGRHMTDGHVTLVRKVQTVL
jgi:hypothetical protein